MIVKKVNDTVMCEYLYNVTTRCNCRCKHCVPKVYAGKNQELTSKKMIELYEKSKYLKGNTVNIGGGEPFVKEDLEDFVLYLDKNKIPCVISTNGWFTEKVIHLVEQLEDNKTVRFSISIDGTEERHDEIRRCKGIYKRAMETLKALKERNFDVQVNIVVQKDNVSSLGEFDKIFKALNVPVAYIPEVFVSGDEFNFTPDDIREIFKYVTYPRGRKYLLSQGKFVITNCHAGNNSWHVDSNGDVYACCGGFYRDDSEKFIIGNLVDDDFDTIFMSKRKQQVYEEVVKNCSGCLMVRDVEREVSVFGLDVSYTKDEVAVLKDDLSNISYLNDFSVDGTEWHLLENDNSGKSFRWMKKKKARVFLNVQKVKGKKISFNILNICPTGDSEEKIELKVKVDGKELGMSKCKSGESTITFKIPSSWKIKDLIEVELEVSRLWSPSEYVESTDTRKLGIGVYSVQVE